jgi:uncharacterized membrane protein YadS
MPLQAKITSIFPGLIVCIVIALSTGFLSENYGGPQLLYALLIGLSLHFLYLNERVKAGIDFSSKTILRIGVALLGIRITFGDIGEIGFGAAAIVFLLWQQPLFWALFWRAFWAFRVTSV